MQEWHVTFWISGFFDSLFLAESGGEEQDDGLLGSAKASTVYLVQNKWLSLGALTGKYAFVRTETVIGHVRQAQAFVVNYGEAEAYHARIR